ncbi:hypothetical protein CRM22_007253 [Opisthorchis felineus]|uniref:Small monomeric GTPase n=1 Tax=Opisthorchis felineus TaxID=147828 RepID=A0A4S2LH69_OPIFE|nr:hypothetical protein CRM22_007253 [Opisthorchis felineus]
MSCLSSVDEVSHSIRQEIVRFESVHPSIYAIYDLVDAIEDKNISDSLRQLVVSIEDAFVNSQEWTLSHSVPDIKLGLLGSIQSGKSALVHRYLTGTYLHEESPEGGRFKKEVSLDNQSHLLLIRDEGGPPDQQFSHWIDGVIFVFSLENFESYQTVYEYFTRLSTYRNTTNLPILLVGTQDSNCEPYVRVIDDARARKLATDLKRCVYYETCAAYGLNVERVFQDACMKILQARGATSQNSIQRPITPQFSGTVPSRPHAVLTNSTVSVSNANTADKIARPTQPPVPSTNTRRAEMLSNPGFEPDLIEDCRTNQTLSAATAAALTSGMGVGGDGRQFQTLNIRSSCEADSQLESQLSFDCTRFFASSVVDSPDDWATHPFFLDGQAPHSRPDYLSPSDYSESVIPTPAQHTYSEYSAHASQPSTLTSSVGIHGGFVPFLPNFSPLAQFTPLPIQPPPPPPPPVSHCFDSTTLNPAASMSSVGLGADTVENKGETNESLTPSSTPTHSRKNRRKSNLFKKNEDEKDRGKKLNGIGSGRAIPLKQGFLYKRSSKPLGKEWKTKKYVTLTDDARLTYHPSIHDYMDNTHGKEIDLSRTTVKIPGVAFRQVGGRITSNGLLRSQLSVSNQAGKISASTDTVPSANDSVSSGVRDSTSVKKRHRRIRSNPKSSVGDAEDSEGYEFQLISMDRQWHFEAKGPEERDDWVMYIERAIMTRLQLNESTKRTRAMNNSGSASSNTGLVSSSNLTGGVHSGGDNNSLTSGRSGAGDSSELATTEHLIESIRSVAGNQYCADCGACDPDWASLNLGAMVCISCSGIHRQLGTHISRVRSLHLDEWSSESAAVMCAIGNTLANSVWEAAVPVNAGNRKKPEPNSSREEKEIWIRAKYDRQEFLPPLPYPDAPLQQQLIDAIARQDTRQVVLCLALATPETVNAPYSRQDPRAAIHIAATLGNLVYLQLLLWYNGDPTVTDHEGRNAYYYAHCSQKYDCAEFLRRSGCPKQLVPPSPTGLTPAQMGRSMLPMPVPVPHGQVPPPGSYTQPTTLESHVPTHSALVPCNVSQPYHFSHLQQHQPGLPPPHLPSQVIGIQQNHVLSGHQTGSGSTLAPSMSTPAQAYTHASPTQSTVIQSGGGTTVSGVLTTNSAGMGHRGPLIQQQQQQLLSSCVPYSNGVNQALGATLPRRHGPNPLGPQALQPFIRPLGQQQQQLASTVTRRPQPGLLVERNPVSGLSRVAISNITPPAPTHNAQISYTRPTSTSNVSGSGNLSGIKQQQSTQQQQFITANQEVGL